MALSTLQEAGTVLRSVQIVGRRLETPEIVVLALAPADGRALPPFEAGAHVDVELRPGLVRPYSLCALPGGDGCYRIGVLRDPASRGGSAAVHALAEGDRLRISEPRNQFRLTPGRHHTLLLAGGIGITPLLCMAEALHGEDASFALHYCARSAARAAFLPALHAAGYAGRVHLHVDDGDAGQRLDIAATLAAAPPDAHLYVCGPSGFMAWVIGAAAQAGWPDGRVHREYFNAAGLPPSSGERAFRVRLARSGGTFDIPADASISAVLRAHGIDLPVSCEAGVCGTCLTGVLEGEPDHRDLYLTTTERERGDQMLPCCSRAAGDLLVLDL
jgi:vanillate O-demethylase ferredoxin subunit